MLFVYYPKLFVFISAIKLSPGLAVLYKERGDAQRKLGLKELALQDYRRSVSLIDCYGPWVTSEVFLIFFKFGAFCHAEIILEKATHGIVIMVKRVKITWTKKQGKGLIEGQCYLFIFFFAVVLAAAVVVVAVELLISARHDLLLLSAWHGRIGAVFSVCGCASLSFKAIIVTIFYWRIKSIILDDINLHK